MSDAGSLDVEPGDALDETLTKMRLVVSFVWLSGEAAKADFEIVGRDDSQSVGCLFKHLGLRSEDGWRIVVNKFPMTEYTRCTILWMEAAKQNSDPDFKYMLSVTVIFESPSICLQ